MQVRKLRRKKKNNAIPTYVFYFDLVLVHSLG